MKEVYLGKELYISNEQKLTHVPDTFENAAGGEDRES